MAVYTLTLNPALDRTVYIENFEVDALNRSRDSVTMAGGKGINVSRMLTVLGDDVHTLALTGGRYGDMLISMLADEGITVDGVNTGADTRLNIKIIEDSGRCTELNASGGPVTEEELNRLIGKIDELSLNNTGCPQMWIISGSIPQGVDKSVYKSLVKTLKERGAYVALDCSGDALKNGVSACPSLIKPNAEELSGLVGKKLGTEDEIIEAAEKLYVENSVEIICTMGKDGAVYVGGEGIYTVNSPKVVVRGFAGAGDTFLAAFIHCKIHNMPIEKSLAFSSAAASAKVALPCTSVPAPETAEELARTLTVRKIK